MISSNLMTLNINHLLRAPEFLSVAYIFPGTRFLPKSLITPLLRCLMAISNFRHLQLNSCSSSYYYSHPKSFTSHLMSSPSFRYKWRGSAHISSLVCRLQPQTSSEHWPWVLSRCFERAASTHKLFLIFECLISPGTPGEEDLLARQDSCISGIFTKAPTFYHNFNNINYYKSHYLRE